MADTRIRTDYFEVEGSDTKKVKAQVYYSKGGINYFTYKNEPRGYWLSVTPVEVEVSGPFKIEKTVCMQGYKHFLLEVKRQSSGANNKALMLADEVIVGMVKKVAQEFNLRLPVIEHFDSEGVASGQVGKDGLP